MIVLAVDVGGTSTRAVVLDGDGTRLGYGTAGSGNPTASGTATAAAAIITAAAAAIDQAGLRPHDIVSGVVGIAGASGENGAALLAEVVGAGLPDGLRLESDLLVAYLAGSLAPEGYGLVAGTGAAAVRIRGRQVEATSDGLGWLLGDAGAGFWLGHRAVLATTNLLDHRGPSTALAKLVLARLGIDAALEGGGGGRSLALRQLVDAVYRLRPVELATFAPLVFDAAAAGDDVARRIAADAADALAATLAAIVVPELAGPLVLSGSILAHQPSMTRRVVQSFHDVHDGSPAIVVDNGLAGAAVLALGDHVTVDDSVLERVRASLDAIR